MNKPKVYIAAPLFNVQQNLIIDGIELTFDKLGIPYFSPRKEAEGLKPAPEDMKNPEAWEPLFQKNIEGLNGSDLLLAVVNYALPPDQSVAICTWHSDDAEVTGYQLDRAIHLELPDTGTVWEMGYMRGSGKLVVGFHPQGSTGKLNVMLSHGCDGLLAGWEALNRFCVNPKPTVVNGKMTDHYTSEFLRRRGGSMHHSWINVMDGFDWTACERWTAQQEEVA